MRIIEGKYRRRPLESLPSPRVRPTARRLRETLFEFLGRRIEGARFLDLCAGSGAVGIEALSRGAAHVTFVERSARMCSFIWLNLQKCEVPEAHAEVVQDDAIELLRRAANPERQTWDIVFFDPPYAADYAPVLSFFGAGAGAGLKRRRGVLVVEHHCDNRLQNGPGLLRRWRVVRLGDSCLSFYEKQ